ncbi:hypothetical protein NT05LM_2510a, partial [Listeria marthii FSL S4-120]
SLFLLLLSLILAIQLNYSYDVRNILQCSNRFL